MQLQSSIMLLNIEFDHPINEKISEPQIRICHKLDMVNLERDPIKKNYVRGILDKAPPILNTIKSSKFTTRDPPKEPPPGLFVVWYLATRLMSWLIIKMVLRFFQPHVIV